MGILSVFHKYLILLCILKHVPLFSSSFTMPRFYYFAVNGDAFSTLVSQTFNRIMKNKPRTISPQFCLFIFANCMIYLYTATHYNYWKRFSGNIISSPDKCMHVKTPCRMLNRGAFIKTRKTFINSFGCRRECLYYNLGDDRGHIKSFTGLSNSDVSCFYIYYFILSY